MSGSHSGALYLGNVADLVTKTEANAAYVALFGATSQDTDGKGPLVVIPQDDDGFHFEVRKWNEANNPPNYFGSGRVAAAWLDYDTEALAAGVDVPTYVFHTEVHADGGTTVDLQSESHWHGVKSIMKKYGNASAHCFTATGELHEPGAANPYNEIGLFQGIATNFGSVGGDLSGCEVVVVDSPDGGVTTYASKMKAVLGRVAKYSADRTYESFSFFASSEGTVEPDGILGVNSAPQNIFVRGIDLSEASFTSGVSALFPNNTTLNWFDSTAASQKILGVTAANVTYLRPASAAAHVSIEAFDGTEVFKVEGNNGGTTLNAKSGTPLTVQVAGTTVWSVNAAGIQNFVAGNEATGAGAAALGANCPAATVTAPYKWFKFKSSDGSTVYVPAWK